MATRRWLGSLGSRLLAAFVTVAVAAVAVLAIIAALSVDHHSSALARQQRDELRKEIGWALAAAYQAGGKWTPQNLAALSALARAQGVQIAIVGRHGHQVAMVGGHHAEGHGEPGHHVGPSAGMHEWAAARPLAAAATTPSPTSSSAPSRSGTTTTIPIVVSGRRVGSAQFTFPDEPPAPVDAARAALLRQVTLGAAVAVLVAVAASVFVARRVSRPLLALTDATRAFAAGETPPKTSLSTAPGEIGELGRSFADMVATVRHQDELRRAVIADVAHELRTPVTILRGQTEELLDGIAEATPERVLSLHDEVLRLGRLTDDLAALAAADAAGLSLHPVPVDLAALTDRTARAMGAAFDDADLQLRVDAGKSITVHGDAERLTQVLTNLLGNAAKFTPPGGTVTVAVTRDGADAVLTVADTGPGIPTDEIPHVFDRFWRGRAAGTRTGTGVGLAVVAALVHAHGGSVTAASPPAGGALFTVRLPA